MLNEIISVRDLLIEVTFSIRNNQEKFPNSSRMKKILSRASGKVSRYIFRVVLCRDKDEKNIFVNILGRKEE